MADLRLAEEMRAFNRFYTEMIGSLDERHEGSDLTLGESRVLFTADALHQAEVGEIAAALRLDLAYTSRVLGALETRGLITRSVSASDRRRRHVTLSEAGTRQLAEIKSRSNERMDSLVRHLAPGDRDDLLTAMSTIRQLLDRGTEP